MVTSIGLINEASTKLGGVGSTALPTVLWTTFQGAHRVHAWWHLSNIYGDPHNRLAMVPGHAFHYVWGNQLGTKAAAHVLMIGTRVVECVDQKGRFHNSFAHWNQALRGQLPYFNPRQPEAKKILFLSPSTTYAMSTQTQVLYNYANRVIRATLALFRDGFLLSMHLIGLSKALSYREDVQQQATSEIFVNISSCLEKMAKNEATLLQDLKQHREVIEIVFKGQTDQIISHLEKSITLTSTIHQSVKKVSRATNGVASQLLRCWGNEFYHLFGGKGDPFGYAPNPLLEITID